MTRNPITWLPVLVAGRITKWLVLLAWLALVAVAAPFAGRLSSALKNDAAAWLPRSAESTRALDLMKRFPGGDTFPVLIVYYREAGLSDTDRIRADHDLETLSSRYGSHPAPPAVSRDGSTLVTTIRLPGSLGGPDIVKAVKDIRSQLGSSEGGLDVKVTGPAASLADMIGAYGAFDTTFLVAAVVVISLAFLLVYRSPVLWLLPLLVVGVASQVASAAVYGLVRQTGLTVNSISYAILSVLVYGVGTDYALLLIARYREELHRHPDRHRAMAAALRGAAPAIAASAATVSLGLLCLLVADLSSNRGLGPVGAAAALSALLTMLTLLPALLVVLGRWIFWPVVPRPGTDPVDSHGVWSRAGRAIARSPRGTWVTTGLALGALALGLVQVNLNVSPARQFVHEPDSVKGQRLLAAEFPAGTAQPAVVIARQEHATAVAAAVEGTPGVRSVRPAGEAGGRVMLLAVLDAGPDSGTEGDIIEHLRDRVHGVSGADAMVGGQGAVTLDTRTTVARDQVVVIPMVLLVVLVVLGLLLRSLVAPPVLVATVALSFAATLGAGALGFQRLLGFEGLDRSLLLDAFIFLVALGVDYNIFLTSRMREEAARHGSRAGTLRGLALTGGVITSAGLVLAATFSLLAVTPIVSSIELGLLVAFGVLLDTAVVRSVLVPALGLDLGRWLWWPSRLARRENMETAEPPAEVA